MLCRISVVHYMASVVLQGNYSLMPEKNTRLTHLEKQLFMQVDFFIRLITYSKPIQKILRMLDHQSELAFDH